MEVNVEILTVQQLSQKFGYSISSFGTSFARTAAAIRKNFNVDVERVKEEEGGKVLYQISPVTNQAVVGDNEPDKNLIIDKDAMKNLIDYQFYFFLYILKPHWAFKGTKKEFLIYTGMPTTKKYIEILDLALQSLESKGYIGTKHYGKDNDHYLIFSEQVIDERVEFNTKLLKKCKEIAKLEKKNNLKIPQLIKVWLALEMYEESGEVFTYEDISEMTGLSADQIKDVKKLLIKYDVLKTNIVRENVTMYGKKYRRCRGQEVKDVNGFYYDVKGSE